MISIRKADQRGHFDHGWLNTCHTFSFGNYYDPKHMQFRSLRVMNEDRVQPGQGFGTHGHQEMEIVSYVLEGSLQHQDSMENGSIVQPGEFQRISAGTGILHSEFNASSEELVHFYQIWILPNKDGLEPSYEQKLFPEEEKKAKLRLVASEGAEDGSLKIHQDVKIYLSTLSENDELVYRLLPHRHAWVQVLRGSIRLNELNLDSSDGAAVSDEDELRIKGSSNTEIMLFDLS